MDWGYLKQEEERRIAESLQIIRKLETGEITEFGISDIWSGWGAYFPCKFVDVIDSEQGIVKIYEPGIDTYHTIQACYLKIDE